MTRRAVLLVALLGALLPAPPAAADEGADAGAGPAPAAPGPALEVAVITGNQVNLRVGPRIDVRPVTQLDVGAVLIVVEQLRDWVAVRVPAGFPAAISLDYAVREGADAVRVMGSEVNLRVAPPEPKAPAPGVFFDRVERGALLTLIEVVEPRTGEDLPPGFDDGGWAWVVAPEEVRAFVNERYVRRLGPLSEHQDLVDVARAQRANEAERLGAARREAAARLSGVRLMEEVAKVQQDLVHLRQKGGTDTLPIVALANQMDAALAGEPLAADGVLRLARALREDLEREITLRVARHDAEVARMQGREAPAVPALAETQDAVRLEGEIRYEPTPGWTEAGVFFLWQEARPRYVLRLTTGGPLPHPKFEQHTGAGPRVLEGRLPGERLFGLPVLDVRSILLPEPAPR